MSSKKLYASVILDSLDKSFDYYIPKDLQESLTPGMRVVVPVRNTTRKGFVSEIKETASFKDPKPIFSIDAEKSLITKPLFDLALWISKYYITPIGKVLTSILPASLRKTKKHKEQYFVRKKITQEEIRKLIVNLLSESPEQVKVLEVILKSEKGILLTELLEKADVSKSPINTLVKKGVLEIDRVVIGRSPFSNEDYFKTKPKKLNPDQEKAFSSIKSDLEKEVFKVHLIHGVTGSGKTEVYMQAIDVALKLKKRAIILVPEISLTPQTIERFKSRFDVPIAILHHQISDGERFDAWHGIKEGKFDIVIGARSAVFSPVQNLGLIIVDEEHESSYKQSEEMPCYHARDVACMRGKLENAVVLLGSATPSLESYRNSELNKYHLSELKLRAEVSDLPIVHVIDMKHEYAKKKQFTLFSELLLDKIADGIKRGEQSLLFLNRRGYHSFQMCLSCGKSTECKHCDTALTFHKTQNALVCHLCGYRIEPPPRACLFCGSQDPLRFKGAGTELVEKQLYALFPEVRIIRLDADTTKHKGSQRKLLKEFATGKADILVGTQMIAKGLHFPEVTLVGVLNCDANLNIPDFRSHENAFQILTQVAGRAGRGRFKGEVIFQTCIPDHEVIQFAKNQDYKSFYNYEKEVRNLFQFPPFTTLAKIRLTGTDEKKTESLLQRFREAMIPHLPSDYVLYPVLPSGHAKVKDNFYFQFLVKGQSPFPMQKAFLACKDAKVIPSTFRLHIDINPLNTFF